MKTMLKTLVFAAFLVNFSLESCQSTREDYTVFVFDNGPDYPQNGLFRIVKNGKIGYADERTRKIVIQPQFDCAWPFENGVAKVSKNCTTQKEGEHSIWISDRWFYIDLTGKMVDSPILQEK